MDTLKAEQIGSQKWRVLAIPFYGPMAGGKDLDGEWFDHATDIKSGWFRERPVLFHHGQDQTLGGGEIGVQDDLVEAKDGWWGTVWLDRSHRYWAQVDALIRAGKMFGSSGAISHLVRKSREGHIEVWPHAEQTFTPTPANPYARITAAKVLSGFETRGIALGDDVKSYLADPSGDDLLADLPNGGEPSGDLSTGGDAEAMRLDAQRRLRALEVRLKAL